MKRKNALAALAGAGTTNLPAGLNDPATIKEIEALRRLPVNESGFIAEAEALRRVPVSRRTWFEWRQNKGLPHIRVGGRVLYDWESVRTWLLRQQRGAA